MKKIIRRGAAATLGSGYAGNEWRQFLSGRLHQEFR